MKRASIDDLLLAVEWLDEYETEPEKSACERVAEFLRQEIARRENENMVRKTAREHNVPRKLARAALKRAQERSAR